MIDIGVSAKRTREALWELGVDTDSIAAIFITHEHSDHISGLRVFASKHGTRVYSSAGTLQELERMDLLNGKFQTDIIPQAGIEACGMLVRSFRTSHDSRESVGYTITTADQKRIAVATDTGIVTAETRAAITGCDLVMLESNHDVRMLQNGAYPYPLKQRILSDRGHLSNEVCAEVAAELVENGTTRLVLAHLSKENNLPPLAFETTKAALTGAGAALGTDYLLSVAGQEREITYL